MRAWLVPLVILMLLAHPLGSALAKEEGGHGGGGHGKEGGKEGGGTEVKMEPFLVNLADEGGKRYLKLTIIVDVKEEKYKKLLEERLPIIRDGILLLLTSKTVQDISSLEGKLKLRQEVRRLVSRPIGAPEALPVVYFTEFFIQ